MPVTAFAPDAGESVSSLIANPPPSAPVPPILPRQDGFLMLDKEKFQASFAGRPPASWPVRRYRGASPPCRVR